MADEKEIYFDPHSDIASAFYALEAIDSLNVYDKETGKRVTEIKEMSLKIIYEAITIIHSVYGEETETDTQG